MGPVTYTFEELIAHKESGMVSAEAVEKLRADADKILGMPTLSVTKIKLPRPSGDAHDYVSMGIYWWPNPDTPDGLPYVNRDGYVNPDTKSENNPGALYGRINTLALAAFYLPERAPLYAECAHRLLYDWYVNPETRMNPNAKYAQGIPGVCEGRGTGLIDFATAYTLFNGIGILECLGLIDAQLLAEVKAWFVEFADWILTHEYGLRIDMGTDNHASWHDANLLATAVFTDRVSLKKNICLTAYEKRLRFLVKPDGSQPSELRRTKAMGYSFYNLSAMLVIANIAERLGYKNYWGIDEVRGNCILKSAIDFLYPYVMNPESFPYQELYIDKQRHRIISPLLSVAKRYPDEDYAERAAALIAECGFKMLEPAL